MAQGKAVTVLTYLHGVKESQTALEEIRAKNQGADIDLIELRSLKVINTPPPLPSPLPPLLSLYHYSSSTLSNSTSSPSLHLYFLSLALHLYSLPLCLRLTISALPVPSASVGLNLSAPTHRYQSSQHKPNVIIQSQTILNYPGYLPRQ